jgi:hypothetical protein
MIALQFLQALESVAMPPVEKITLFAVLIAMVTYFQIQLSRMQKAHEDLSRDFISKLIELERNSATVIANNSNAMEGLTEAVKELKK